MLFTSKFVLFYLTFGAGVISRPVTDNNVDVSPRHLSSCDEKFEPYPKCFNADFAQWKYSNLPESQISITNVELVGGNSYEVTVHFKSDDTMSLSSLSELKIMSPVNTFIYSRNGNTKLITNPGDFTYTFTVNAINLIDGNNGELCIPAVSFQFDWCLVGVDDKTECNSWKYNHSYDIYTGCQDTIHKSDSLYCFRKKECTSSSSVASSSSLTTSSCSTTSSSSVSSSSPSTTSSCSTTSSSSLTTLSCSTTSSSSLTTSSCSTTSSSSVSSSSPPATSSCSTTSSSSLTTSSCSTTPSSSIALSSSVVSSSSVVTSSCSTISSTSIGSSIIQSSSVLTSSCSAAPSTSTSQFSSRPSVTASEISSILVTGSTTTLKTISSDQPIAIQTCETTVTINSNGDCITITSTIIGTSPLIPTKSGTSEMSVGSLTSSLNIQLGSVVGNTLASENTAMNIHPSSENEHSKRVTGVNIITKEDSTYTAHHPLPTGPKGTLSINGNLALAPKSLELPSPHIYPSVDTDYSLMTPSSSSTFQLNNRPSIAATFNQGSHNFKTLSSAPVPSLGVSTFSTASELSAFTSVSVYSGDAAFSKKRSPLLWTFLLAIAYI